MEINNYIESALENLIGIKLAWSLIVLIVSIIVSKIVKNLAYRVIKDNKKYYNFKKNINYITGSFITLYIVSICMNSGINFTTYIGFLSAGIAISLREIFTNIAGWIFIETRKPFEVGHRITIGNQKGDVIDKSVFQFTLIEVSPEEDGEQSTGRIIDIPNGFVFTHPTINYTKGFEYIWNEVNLVLSFDSDWKKAKELLLNIANKETDLITRAVSKQINDASRKYMIHYNNLTPIVYTDVIDDGIKLSLRYLCEPKKRRITENMIWEDILNMINENLDIELAHSKK